MRYLGPDDLRRALPMEAALTAMESAFGDDREVPPRTLVGSSLFMPGRVGSVSGIKVVSTTPGDPVGIVAVFDPTGRPLGLVDGPTLTALRTGAAAGLATRILAPEDASVMAMLGCGSMAADQVEAVRAVRPIERVLAWSRNPERARRFADRVGAEVAADCDQAVAAAAVITTATPARTPLFSDGSVQTGAHINAVGAFTPEMVEVPAETVHRAFVVVDDRAAAAAEAGDLLQAGREPDATIGDLLQGRSRSGQPVTLFKSVGIASQDVAAAALALERAAAQGLGSLIGE